MNDPSKNRKREALEEMARRGGSANEREIAAARLKQTPAVAERDETREDKWGPSRMLVRTRGGANAFLKEPALRYFLSQVKQGQSITYRSIPYTSDYGAQDFYLIIDLGLKHKYLWKNGSSYVVTNKDGFVTTWNKFVDQMYIK